MSNTCDNVRMALHKTDCITIYDRRNAGASRSCYKQLSLTTWALLYTTNVTEIKCHVPQLCTYDAYMRETNHVICYVVLNGRTFTISSKWLQPFWGSRLGTRLTYKLTQIHMWLNWLKLRHRFLCEHRDNHINSATTNLQACDSKFNHVDAHIKIVFMTLTSSGSCFGFCLFHLIWNMVCREERKL